jgi:hypothetical protein
MHFTYVYVLEFAFSHCDVIVNAKHHIVKTFCPPRICRYQQDVMKLVSYNIRKAIGTDRLRRPERIIDVLHEIAPDIILPPLPIAAERPAPGAD